MPPRDLASGRNPCRSNKEFELFRKCLQAKQKELKKAGRGNKDKVAVAITDEEVDILYI